MVPLQLILLLVLAGLPEQLGARPLPRTTLGAVLIIASLFTSFLGLIIAVIVRSRTAIRAIHQPSVSASAISWKMDQLISRARWTTVLLTATFLFASPLPTMIKTWLAGTQLLGKIPHLSEVLFLTPAVISWLSFWTATYYIDSASRERSLAYRLAQSLPAHDMPTLSQFLLMQCRHNFYILVPVVLHTIIIGIGQFLERWVPYAEVAAAPIGIVVVLLMMPWLVVRFWSTVPMRGPLRARLDAVAQAHRLRFRNILLWKTHNAVTNAAILGWVPFARYFLMTDALLESLTDPQIEAVFAHEVGHGVHRHVLWYLLAFIGAMALAAGISMIWGTMLPVTLAEFAGGPDARASTEAIISTGLLGLMLAFGFPLISHRFEHQADWFACRHMARMFTTPATAKVLAAATTPLPHPALAELTTASEAISLAQYISVEYPHAAPKISSSTQTIAVPLSGNPISSVPQSNTETISPQTFTAPLPQPATIIAPELTPAQAGAEIFISSLDTIIEVANKSRARRGWMHPSINNRIDLLRTLAINPATLQYFETKMHATRIWIMTFIGIGFLTAAAGIYLEAHTPPNVPPHSAPEHPAMPAPQTVTV